MTNEKFFIKGSMKASTLFVILLVVVILWALFLSPRCEDMTMAHTQSRSNGGLGLGDGADVGTWNISWDPPTDNGGDPNCCTYALQIGSTSPVTVSTTSYAYTDFDVAQTSQPQVSVAAINSAGTGPAATATLPFVPLGTVQGLTAATSFDSQQQDYVITISWTMPFPYSVNAGGVACPTVPPSIFNYSMSINGGPAIAIAPDCITNVNPPPSDSINWYLSGLNPLLPTGWEWNTSYTFAVNAYFNNASNGAPGPVSSFTLNTGNPPSTLPGAPGTPAFSYAVPSSMT